MAQQAETLGDVLYAGNWTALIPERDWVRLVRSTANGDQLAFHELVERSYRLVFALSRTVARDRKLAEELTLDVLWEAWRAADRYDATQRTVLAWIMDLAQTRSLRARPERAQSAESEAEGLDASETLLDALHEGLGRRIAREVGGIPALPRARLWIEPGWKDVAPGISCKLLATDTDAHRVSMLVRLGPGGVYPAHTHFGTEELHLLQGELWIDEKKLYPGDYNHCAPGTGDTRVWSETGCMCVLITSTRDRLR